MASQQQPRSVVLKIIILGDTAVGKTSILEKYVNNNFSQQHKATIGTDFLVKRFVKDGKLNVHLQMWDTAGQERFQSLSKAFYRGADACVLVYDVTNEASFKNVEQWRSDFVAMNDVDDAFPFILLGNKTDLGGQRRVDASAGSSYASRLGMVFKETSAQSGEGIDEAMESLTDVACKFSTGATPAQVIENITLREEEDAKPATPTDQSPCAAC